MTELDYRAGETPPTPGWYWFHKHKEVTSRLGYKWIMVRIYRERCTDHPSGVTTDQLMVWIAKPSGSSIALGEPLESWPEGDWAGPIAPPPPTLEACPFCGKRKLERIKEGDRHYILCHNCGGRGPGSYDRGMAVTFWDERGDDKR